MYTKEVETLQKRNSSLEDFMSLQSMSHAEYCAEKSLFVYCKNRFCKDKNQFVSEIILKHLDTDKEEVITAGGNRESNPRFSTNGDKLAFLSNADGYGQQMWILDFRTKKYKRITTMRFGVIDPVWSPTGKKIAYLSTSPEDFPLEKLQEIQTVASNETYTPKSEPIVIEDFGYKTEGAGFTKAQNLHLWVTEIDGNNTKRLTDGNYNHMQHNWSPDGTNLVFISDRGRSKKDFSAADLFIVHAETGLIKQISSKSWVVTYPIPFRPLFTPNGKYVIAAFLEDSMVEDFLNKGYPLTRLHRVAIDGTEDLDFFPVEDPNCFECTAFPYNAGAPKCYDKAQISSDGKHVIFISGWKGQTNIYRARVYGDPYVESVAVGNQVFAGLGVPQNGVMLVSKSSYEKYGDYYLMDEKSGVMIKQITNENDFLNEVAISEPQEIWFDTLDGESQVHGWVMPPQNMEEGKKYPAILYIHGGPHPYYCYGFDYEHQCLAGSGFAVIYCNPRGSGGYGRTHLNMKRAFDGSAYYDCLQMVDEACKAFEWIDKDRIGVTGGSYGGYLTNHIATRSSRFKAYVTQRCISNMLIQYASSDMQGNSLDYPNFEEFMIQKIKDSPVAYAENVKSPMLILHGINDWRTPVEHAHQWFVALKDTHNDLPIKMVLFPQTGHYIPTVMKQKLYYHDEMIQWFTKYL